MGNKKSRSVDSGRKDSLGRTIRVSGDSTQRRSDAPAPPSGEGLDPEFAAKIGDIVDDSLTQIRQADDGKAHNDKPLPEPASQPLSKAEMMAAARTTSWAEQAAPNTGATVRIVGTNVNQRHAGQTGTVTDYRPDSGAAPGCRKVLMDDGHEINIFPNRPGEYEIVDHNLPAHPEYDYNVAWTEPAVRADIEALPWRNVADTTKEIEQVLERHGYDSINRELAFWHWSQRTGLDYDQFYNAWLHS